MTSLYDPFARGRFPVGERTIPAVDRVRRRPFECEIWYPAAGQHTGQDSATETQDSFTIPPGDSSRRQQAVRDAAPLPRADAMRDLPGRTSLIVYSHPSGGGRRAATFLCTHLSSHGYVVAALDHSELVAPELARKQDETDEQRDARANAWIANRVPDLRFLIDQVLDRAPLGDSIRLDPDRVGVVGHSFGGWTALAATEVEPRIHAVVALAPAGSSRPKPGMLAAKLTFAWGRDVPTLYLAAEDDTSMPLAGQVELFERTPASKWLVVLRSADHMHFMDDVERMHETVRKMTFTGELAWLPKEMRPIEELCSGERSHAFTRALTLGHMDASLRADASAQRWMSGDLEAELAARGIQARVHAP